MLAADDSRCYRQVLAWSYQNQDQINSRTIQPSPSSHAVEVKSFTYSWLLWSVQWSSCYSEGNWTPNSLDAVLVRSTNNEKVLDKFLEELEESSENFGKVLGKAHFLSGCRTWKQSWKVQWWRHNAVNLSLPMQRKLNITGSCNHPPHLVSSSYILSLPNLMMEADSYQSLSPYMAFPPIKKKLDHKPQDQHTDVPRSVEHSFNWPRQLAPWSIYLWIRV